MKPSKYVITQVMAGKTTIPIGNKGYYWKAYKFPPHLTFRADDKWEIELARPYEFTKKKDVYTLIKGKIDGTQFLWKEK